MAFRKEEHIAASVLGHQKAPIFLASLLPRPTSNAGAMGLFGKSSSAKAATSAAAEASIQQPNDGQPQVQPGVNMDDALDPNVLAAMDAGMSVDDAMALGASIEASEATTNAGFDDIDALVAGVEDVSAQIEELEEKIKAKKREALALTVHKKQIKELEDAIKGKKSEALAAKNAGDVEGAKACILEYKGLEKQLAAPALQEAAEKEKAQFLALMREYKRMEDEELPQLRARAEADTQDEGNWLAELDSGLGGDGSEDLLNELNDGGGGYDDAENRKRTEQRLATLEGSIGEMEGKILAKKKEALARKQQGDRDGAIRAMTEYKGLEPQLAKLKEEHDEEADMFSQLYGDELADDPLLAELGDGGGGEGQQRKEERIEGLRATIQRMQAEAAKLRTNGDKQAAVAKVREYKQLQAQLQGLESQAAEEDEWLGPLAALDGSGGGGGSGAASTGEDADLAALMGAMGDDGAPPQPPPVQKQGSTYKDLLKLGATLAIEGSEGEAGGGGGAGGADAATAGGVSGGGMSEEEWLKAFEEATEKAAVKEKERKEAAESRKAIEGARKALRLKFQTVQEDLNELKLLKDRDPSRKGEYMVAMKAAVATKRAILGDAPTLPDFLAGATDEDVFGAAARLAQSELHEEIDPDALELTIVSATLRGASSAYAVLKWDLPSASAQEVKTQTAIAASDGGAAGSAFDWTSRHELTFKRHARSTSKWFEPKKSGALRCVARVEVYGVHTIAGGFFRKDEEKATLLGVGTCSMEALFHSSAFKADVKLMPAATNDAKDPKRQPVGSLKLRMRLRTAIGNGAVEPNEGVGGRDAAKSGETRSRRERSSASDAAAARMAERDKARQERSDARQARKVAAGR